MAHESMAGRTSVLARRTLGGEGGHRGGRHFDPRVYAASSLHDALARWFALAVRGVLALRRGSGVFVFVDCETKSVHHVVCDAHCSVSRAIPRRALFVAPAALAVTVVRTVGEYARRLPRWLSRTRSRAVR